MKEIKLKNGINKDGSTRFIIAIIFVMFFIGFGGHIFYQKIKGDPRDYIIGRQEATIQYLTQFTDELSKQLDECKAK